MSGRDLFGAALRLLGVYFMSIAASRLLEYCGAWIEHGLPKGGSQSTYAMQSTYIISGLSYAVCGAVAFFGAGPITRFSYGPGSDDNPSP